MDGDVRHFAVTEAVTTVTDRRPLKAEASPQSAFDDVGHRS
jgi:hypothetical protein